MRIVNGIDSARRALSKGRTLDLASVPPSFTDTAERLFGTRLTPAETVAKIVDVVREEGDAGILRLAHVIEGSRQKTIEVSPEQIEAGLDSVDPRLLEALRLAADRVRGYHEAASPQTWIDFNAGYGALSMPCETAGVYVPGGSAPLPSTVLMTAIPARVAGVRNVVLCSPAGESGLPDPTVLAAARIAGVDRVFAIGGAQAIAAMAYGTETVPPVDIVCGPGNVFVTLAKKMVYGDVGIDGLYGPTETLIVADEFANPTLCAADMLAQAEHDPMARAVLVCTSQDLAKQVSSEIETRLQRLERESVARAAIEGQSCIAVVENLDEAIDLANWFAPEHMCLSVSDPWAWVGRVKTPGRYSSESFPMRFWETTSPAPAM